MNTRLPHPRLPHRWRPLAVLVATVVLATACGGSSSPPEAAATAAVDPAGGTVATSGLGVETIGSLGTGGTTREQALAFCDASAALQTSLGRLAASNDFAPAFESATDAYERWAPTIPSELTVVAAPVIAGWSDVVGTFVETQDPARTGAVLADLTAQPDFLTAVAAFEEFGAGHCVPDTTLDDPSADPTSGLAGDADEALGAADDGTGDAGASVAYEGTGGRLSGAGLTFTAEQCDIPVGAPTGVDASKHWDAVAIAGTDVFLAGQNGVDTNGVLKFRQADEASCRLLVAEDFGAEGTLFLGEPINHVSASPSGTVLASNTIFETWAVDAATGAQTPCGRGSFAEISPDGAVGYGFFPGSGDLRRYDVSTDCTVTDAAVAVGSQPNPSAAAWVHDDLFVVGGFLVGGGAGVTALDRAGNELWTVGGSPADVGEDGFGAVSAVSPCAGRVCVVDSNFRTMHILNPETGDQLGVVDLQQLVGLPVLWFNGLAEEADASTLWLVGGIEQLAGDGTRTGQVQGLVYRVTVS